MTPAPDADIFDDPPLKPHECPPRWMRRRHAYLRDVTANAIFRYHTFRHRRRPLSAWFPEPLQLFVLVVLIAYFLSTVQLFWGLMLGIMALYYVYGPLLLVRRPAAIPPDFLSDIRQTPLTGSDLVAGLTGYFCAWRKMIALALIFAATLCLLAWRQLTILLWPPDLVARYAGVFSIMAGFILWQWECMALFHTDLVIHIQRSWMRRWFNRRWRMATIIILLLLMGGMFLVMFVVFALFMMFVLPDLKHQLGLAQLDMRQKGVMVASGTALLVLAVMALICLFVGLLPRSMWIKEDSAPKAAKLLAFEIPEDAASRRGD